MITVTLIPILKDNYAYLLEAKNGSIGVVDPGEAEPVIHALEERGLKLHTIINTHHHGDHIGGNAELIKKYGAKLAGPAIEENKIGPLDIKLEGGTHFEFGGESVQIIHTPGHTMGHICLYWPESKILFSGDTLFSMGCGRLFEGTPDQMFDSLQKLKNLPGDTRVYCGHEYTLANAEFCRTVDPDNNDLKDRYEEMKRLRSNEKPTIPFLLKDDLDTNIFLRAQNAEDFAKYRAQKDAA